MQFLSTLGRGSSGIVYKARLLKNNNNNTVRSTLTKRDRSSSEMDNDNDNNNNDKDNSGKEKDDSKDIIVAVKVIQLDLDEKVCKNIMTELRTLMKAKNNSSNNVNSNDIDNKMTSEQFFSSSFCPNIVTIHNAFFIDGHIRIVLEYMNSGSLQDLIQSMNNNDEKKTNNNNDNKGVAEKYIPIMTAQVLNGLDHLHRKLRVVHRDVKPSNILISKYPKFRQKKNIQESKNNKNQCKNITTSKGSNSKDNENVGDGEEEDEYDVILKLSDFGVSSELTNSVAVCSTWVGTVTYMSPERIKGILKKYH